MKFKLIIINVPVYLYILTEVEKGDDDALKKKEHY